MKHKKLSIPDVIVFEPQVFEDQRGFFFESYNESNFKEITGLEYKFVQDNHSRSSKNILRGLHFQTNPMAQGKLVRVVNGAVFDVAVDVRPNSITLGKWVGEVLSDENKKQLWIPPGFAHGFYVLTENVDFLYKTTNFYSPKHEKCLMWNDPALGIEWPLTGNAPVVSIKDNQGLLLSDLLKC